jgi:hypothetical protein
LKKFGDSVGLAILGAVTRPLPVAAATRRRFAGRRNPDPPLKGTL